jgi:DNA-binding XRE family transcriptional regulator|uniref:helix-turn-helix transcriptional regulator n=1 Tax=uncultured Allisonella sp. TaxID=339338 RepID=UPI002804B6D2|nr:helix-turn-helix transcriptional regulator [uncultured Allisonella sp.]
MDRKNIAKKLIALRILKNETQKAVAEAIGVSESSLAMYEAGERIPRDAVKIKIANHFGVSVQSIFFGDNVHLKCTEALR